MPEFDSSASRYSDHAVVQRQLADWCAEWLPSVETANARAVELGAGPGLFTEKLVALHSQLLATDVSPAMVAEGKQLFPEVDWRVADAWALSEGQWDYIYSTSLLQWCPEPVTVLRRWRNCLAPGGRMMTGFYIEPTLPELNELSAFESPVQWRDAVFWRNAFSEANLKLVRSEVSTRRLYYDSALAFFRVLHGTGAYQARQMSVSALRRMIADYQQRFSEKSQVYATWTFMRIEAEV